MYEMGKELQEWALAKKEVSGEELRGLIGFNLLLPLLRLMAIRLSRTLHAEICMSKVGDDQIALLDKEAAGIDIAMDDADRM